jgi:subtilisin family serine protease
MSESSSASPEPNVKYAKIGPSLWSVIDDFEGQNFQRPEMQYRTMAVYRASAAARDTRVSVLLRCDPKADFQRYTKYGIIINERTGRIRTANLPIQKIGDLSQDPTIEQMLASRYMNILMDVATVVVDVPRFQLNSTLRGRNVILGIIDSGIDCSHPAFAGRILRIWDQTIKGVGVPEGHYGAELLPSAFATTADTLGHGTHVAGIAGGSDKTYPGIAPEAEYVIVKSDLSESNLINAVSYVFRIAKDLNRPAVVNLSMGAHFDPHDGTDPLSVHLDSQSGPGRIVCCAAGNEGEDYIHTAVQITSGMIPVRFGLWPNSPTGHVRAELNGWYSSTDSFEISVIDPTGSQTPYQGIITSGPSIRTYSLPEGSVRIGTPGPDPGNGDHNFLVQVQPLSIPEDPENQTPWRLVIRVVSASNGRVDIWAPCDAAFDKSPEALEMKIGTPGACASAVTVAAYTTKNKWIDIQKRQQAEAFALNTITALSSPGPLRNGTKKPDVAAPGALIAAPASCRAAVEPRLQVAPGFYLSAGTSMATPFISGIAALLLERNPSLDPSGLKTILRRAGEIPGKPSGTFDPQWGYGLLNALKL